MPKTIGFYALAEALGDLRTLRSIIEDNLFEPEDRDLILQELTLIQQAVEARTEERKPANLKWGIA